MTAAAKVTKHFILCIFITFLQSVREQKYARIRTFYPPQFTRPRNVPKWTRKIGMLTANLNVQNRLPQLKTMIIFRNDRYYHIVWSCRFHEK